MSITFADIDRAFGADPSPVRLLEAVHFKKPLVAYRIGKSIRSLNAAFQDIVNERNRVITLYGKTTDGPDAYIDRTDAEAVRAFTRDMNAFLDIEPVDLQVYPVKVSDVEGVDIPVSVFVHLWFLFADEPEGD